MTQKEIAKTLKLSATAVSMVLKDPSTNKVSETKKKQIFELLKNENTTPGYRKTPPAVGLLLGPDFDSQPYPFTTRMLSGIQEMTDQYELSIILETRFEKAVRLSHSGLVSGLVINQSLPANQMEQINPKLPRVVLNCGFDKQSCDCIFSDEDAGIEQAVDHLVEMGHRCIAHFTYYSDGLTLGHGKLRQNGYYKALIKHDIAVDKNLVFKIGSSSISHSYASLQQAFDAFLALETRPTAIIAYNDYMAFQLMSLASYQGINIPDDLSIIGFDNVSESSQSQPSLTTIDADYEEMGRMAVESIMQQQNSRQQERTPKIIQCRTKLIKRNSVAQSKI